MRLLVSGLSGILFALGLSLSGMTQPHKVIGFLDVFGKWDVSLIFVMAGAILVHGSVYTLTRRRSAPLLDSQFFLPQRHHIDRKLLMGSAFFGIGWALAGLCTGPAIVSLVSGQWEIFAFLAAMLLGSWLVPKITG
ncbi:MAG: DUF6691 family protein [Pseudomonadota bacterium]